ncbi:hypothetical protein ACAG39_01610 [Caldicellulosiruptoraceae bacterium PP1]
MGYRLCPKCELNRISENEELCPICKKDFEQFRRFSETNKKLCPYCKEEYIPEDQEMCESCFEERLLTGVVDDSEIEEEKVTNEFPEEYETVLGDELLDDLVPEDADLDDTSVEIDEPLDVVDDELLVDDDLIEDDDENQ